MIDRAKFFDGIRHSPFPGALTAGQVDGINFILDEWTRRNLTDLRWLAYMLGTVFWECDKTMQPIKEGGGLKYLQAKKYWPWYGRGFVQLTWERNYKAFRDRVKAQFGVDITDNPDAAMQPHVAAFVMFEGMIHGEFTGKKLGDYFGAKMTDWVNARRIINGTDRAAEVGSIAKQFYADLVAAV